MMIATLLASAVSDGGEDSKELKGVAGCCLERMVFVCFSEALSRASGFLDLLSSLPCVVTSPSTTKNQDERRVVAVFCFRIQHSMDCGDAASSLLSVAQEVPGAPSQAGIMAWLVRPPASPMHVTAYNRAVSRPCKRPWRVAPPWKGERISAAIPSSGMHLQHRTHWG